MYNFNRKHHPVGDNVNDSAANAPVQLPVMEENAESEHLAHPQDPQHPEVPEDEEEDARHDSLDPEGDDDDDNANAFTYDPTYQGEEQQPQQSGDGDTAAHHGARKDKAHSGGRSTGDGAGAGAATRPGFLLENGYNTSGAMNRFQAKRGMTILSEFASPPEDMPADEVFTFFRGFVQKHSATPPKPWRQIRFDLPATVAELRLVPPSPEPVQLKEPVIPSPCLVLLLDGAIPEGMSQKDYMVQMVQYLLDLMKYNNAATAITTLKFIKKGNELSQLVFTVGLDVRLAVKLLNALQDAGVRAGFGQPIQDYKPNATFAVTDYKLTLNGGAGISREQVEHFLMPFRETNTVDINVIAGYNKGVYYAPVKRPEAVYNIIWNPYISVIMQADLFARFGVLVTMAECPHFFLQKGVPYHIQKQQMEIEKARLLLLRQQRGDVDGGDDALGNIYDYVKTGADRGGGGKPSHRADKDSDSDDDGIAHSDEENGDDEEGRRRKDGASVPNWVAQAEQVSIFNDNDLLALQQRTKKKNATGSPATAATSATESSRQQNSSSSPKLTFVGEEDEMPMATLLKTATAAAAVAPPPAPTTTDSATSEAAMMTAARYASGRSVGGPESAYGGGRGSTTTTTHYGYESAAQPPPLFDNIAVAGDDGSGSAPPATVVDLPELVSDHDDDDDNGNGNAGGGLVHRGGAGDPANVASYAPQQRQQPLDWEQEQRPQQQERVGDFNLSRPQPQQQPEVLLSWNMTVPGNAGGGGGGGGGVMASAAAVSGAYGSQQQQQGGLPQHQHQQQGPAFDGMDPQGYEDGYYYQQDGFPPQQQQQQQPQSWGGQGPSTMPQPYGWGVGGPQQPMQPQGHPGFGGTGGYPLGQGFGYDFLTPQQPQQQQQQQQQQGYYDAGNMAYGNVNVNVPRARPPPLPMSMEDADKLVAKIQDRVRNAFPSLHLVNPTDTDSVRDMFFSVSNDGRSERPIPELVPPELAKVPVPTTEMDELTDLLEAEYPQIKALLECYEPPLQEARTRLALSLMVSRPQREQALDWTPYVEQTDDDEDGDADKKKGNGKDNSVDKKAKTKEAKMTDEQQLPALLPYLLTTHEGTELSAMLATFYPNEFIGLLARYCLPFLLDTDVVQWVCLAALRADPSPGNALATRVLRHWGPLMRWLNASILLQAEREDKKDAGTKEKAGKPSASSSFSMSTSATAKRLVSQLGNTMDFLLSGLSPSQRFAAAGYSKTSHAVAAFVGDLCESARRERDSDDVGPLLWGADGAARRTLLRLYLSADIIDGADLAAALFTKKADDNNDSGGKDARSTRVHSIARDSFYFILVALSKSLLSPSLNVQTAAFCGRYLQYMEIQVAATSSKDAGRDLLGEKEGVQLIDAAFKHLVYLDAYLALRQGYLVATESVPHFPLVHAKLSNEVPPFPLSVRPQEYYEDPNLYGNAVPPPQTLSFDPSMFHSNNNAYYEYYYGSSLLEHQQQQQQGGLASGGLLDGSSAGGKEGGGGPSGTTTAKPLVDWRVAMKSYPLKGEPFTPLPTGWTASLSRSFGQYYFKPSSSIGGSPSYNHPTDKTTFYASPQAFIQNEANSAAALHEVIQLANAKRRALTPPEAPFTRDEVDAWLNDQRKRNDILDAAAMEKFSIQYKPTTTANVAAGGRKRSRSPPPPPSAKSTGELTASALAARLTRVKNYPAKGPPYPDVFRGWTANMSSSTGLYVFRPPAGRKGSSGSGGGGGASEAQEVHPVTKRRYRVSPQEFVRHRNIKYEDIAREAKVELVEVQEWMTDQRYRSPAMDAAVVRLAKVNYAFREELDADRAPPQKQQRSSGKRSGGGGGGGSSRDSREQRGGGRR